MSLHDARTCLLRLGRSAYGIALYACGSLARAERRQVNHLTILTYHRVLPGPRKAAYGLPDLVVTPESLRIHCSILLSRYVVLPLAEALVAWAGQEELRRPLAVLTFDDGYQDNYLYAAPVLAEMKLRATFFPVVGLVGTEELPWYDRLVRALQVRHAGKVDGDGPDDRALRAVLKAYGSSTDPAARVLAAVNAAKQLAPQTRRTVLAHLESKGKGLPPLPEDLIMAPAQLVELAVRGHEIGSHGLTHEILTMLSDGELQAEVRQSRLRLECCINRPVISFSYPNGDVDARVAKAVADAGYTCAVTTDQGHNGLGRDRFLLRRWFIHQDRLTGLGPCTSQMLLRGQLCGLTASRSGILSRLMKQT
jgi:peptidoglycan/xylan/chitin deacetylase (PgdA/CDA1 family)